MVLLGVPASHRCCAHPGGARARPTLSAPAPTGAAATAAPSRRGPIDPRVLALSPALRTHLLAGAAAAVVLAAATLGQAEAVSRLLPRLVHGDRDAIRPLVVALVAVGAVRAALAAAVDASATRALLATRTRIRGRVLDRLAALRPDRRRDLGPARAAALSGPAVDALEPWVRSYLSGLVVAVVVPLAAGLRILGADPVSALILAVVVPLIPVFMVLIGLATESQAAHQWAALDRLSGRFLDTLTGLPTLRLFGLAERQAERVREVTDRYRQATMRTLRVAFLSALVLELLATLSVALVAVSLGVRLTHGSIDLRTALVVLLLAPECLLPIRRVSAAFHAATAGLDAAVEVHAALALPTVAAGDRPVPPAGPLAARRVTVRDPERGMRLAPTDLEVGPGELVAVWGPSGSGKSTLLDVLRGAIAPDAGTVTLGGTAVGELRPTERAEAVRWAPQRSGALGASVAASVALGHPAGPATDAAVAAALADVGLEASADAPPAELSGGQRRRLAVARLLVGVHRGEARVLLVDEPTAQLDDDTAARVAAALRRAADAGAGVVVATHDPSLRALADRTVEVAATGGDRPPASSPEGDGAGAEATIAAGAAHRHRVEATPVPDPVPGWVGHGDGGAERAAGAEPTAGDPRHGALRWVLQVARPYRPRLIGGQALGVLTEACTIGLAGTAAWLVVRAAERPSFADLAVAAVAVRAFGVGKGALRYGERLASHDATLRLLAGLRARVVARLARLAPTGLPAGGEGDLLARLVDDIDRLQDLFLRVLGPLVSSLVVATAAAGVAAVIDPGAGAALLGAVGLVGLALPWTAWRAARRRGPAWATARGAVTEAIVDLAAHADEVVACGAEPEYRAQVEAAAARVDALDRRFGRSSAATAAAMAAAPAWATALVVAIHGAAGPGRSGPALGLLVLGTLAVIELVAPLAATGDALARVEASAERVRALLRRPEPRPDPADPGVAPDHGDVRLEAVAVGWPGGGPVVEGVDLAVAEGGRAVVTGPSGSGKSTVAALLVAFLTPSAGTYRVGGVDAEGLTGDAVRSRVTWCQQEPWFADSILADNLRIARPDATDDELWAVLGVVHLDRWARSLPDGLATRLERDAEAMSGGQRQRLALARGLLGDRRAIVLDEPTAHLDADTAGVVLADLLAASADRAVVLIAHGEAGAGIGPTYRIEPRPGRPAHWADASAGGTD
jgi:ATP-binding cassette subfamily C protein CydCD